MSPRHLRLYIAASATSLTLLSFIVAGTSSPSVLLLAVIGLVPPVMMPLWPDVTGAKAQSTALRGTLHVHPTH